MPPISAAMRSSDTDATQSATFAASSIGQFVLSGIWIIRAASNGRLIYAPAVANHGGRGASI